VVEDNEEPPYDSRDRGIIADNIFNELCKRDKEASYAEVVIELKNLTYAAWRFFPCSDMYKSASTKDKVLRLVAQQTADNF
jgi:hypothetical protein